jgi:thioredoxin 1
MSWGWILLVGALGLWMLVRFANARMIATMEGSLTGRQAPELGGRVGELVSGDRPALLYFHSPSCGPCRAMGPVIAELSEEGRPVHAVDVSTDPHTAQQFGIMGTPTTLVVRGGRVEQALVGPQPPGRLREALGAA